MHQNLTLSFFFPLSNNLDVFSIRYVNYMLLLKIVLGLSLKSEHSQSNLKVIPQHILQVALISETKVCPRVLWFQSKGEVSKRFCSSIFQSFPIISETWGQ